MATMTDYVRDLRLDTDSLIPAAPDCTVCDEPVRRDGPGGAYSCDYCTARWDCAGERGSIACDGCRRRVDEWTSTAERWLCECCAEV
jgi:hypothetical protein